MYIDFIESYRQKCYNIPDSGYNSSKISDIDKEIEEFNSFIFIGIVMVFPIAIYINILTSSANFISCCFYDKIIIENYILFILLTLSFFFLLNNLIMMYMNKNDNQDSILSYSLLISILLFFTFTIMILYTINYSQYIFAVTVTLVFAFYINNFDTPFSIYNISFVQILTSIIAINIFVYIPIKYATIQSFDYSLLIWLSTVYMYIFLILLLVSINKWHIRINNIAFSNTSRISIDGDAKDIRNAKDKYYKEEEEEDF